MLVEHLFPTKPPTLFCKIVDDLLGDLLRVGCIAHQAASTLDSPDDDKLSTVGLAWQPSWLSIFTPSYTLTRPIIANIYYNTGAYTCVDLIKHDMDYKSCKQFPIGSDTCMIHQVSPLLSRGEWAAAPPPPPPPRQVITQKKATFCCSETVKSNILLSQNAENAISETLESRCSKFSGGGGGHAPGPP